jgi:hypothetical protein
VAARLKLKPERIAAIESGSERLERDGRGRSIARALALSIGAHPEAAVCLLRPAKTGGRARSPSRRVFTGAALGTALALIAGAASLVAFAIWAARETGPIGPARAQEVVYRTDYVGRLLHDPGVGSVEARSGVRQTRGGP